MKNKPLPDLLVSLLLCLTALILCGLILKRCLTGLFPGSLPADGKLPEPLYDRAGVLLDLGRLTPLFVADLAAILAAVGFRLFRKNKAAWYVNKAAVHKPYKEGEAAGTAPEQALDGRLMRPAVFRLILLLAALALIVLGVLNGGLRDVLIKAINICTECIGLG